MTPQKYKVIYEKRVAKDFSKIPNYDVVKIIEKIHSLARDEEWLDIKKLQWYAEGLYRLRVGNYRVIYEKDGEVLTIYILEVWHRKEIYR